MVAYSFQKRFAPAIVNGFKTQTIRATGKRQHAKFGDLIQLYVAMRTKHCAKIVPDVICEGCVDVKIQITGVGIDYIAVDNDVLHDDQMEGFAKRDGFSDVSDMHAFWLKSHGLGVFVGKLISWREASQ